MTFQLDTIIHMFLALYNNGDGNNNNDDNNENNNKNTVLFYLECNCLFRSLKVFV